MLKEVSTMWLDGKQRTDTERMKIRLLWLKIQNWDGASEQECRSLWNEIFKLNK